MKTLQVILLGAGCLLSAAAGYARELSEAGGVPAQSRPAQHAGQAPQYREQQRQATLPEQAPKDSRPEQAALPEQKSPLPGEPEQLEISAKARAAAQELLLGAPAQFGIDWLRVEVNPILRERREIRRMMEMRAAQAAERAQKPAPVQDPHLSIGNWRLSVGNTPDGNMSPHPDRMLDARTLRFPMRRDSRADKRPESTQALERLRQK